MSVEEETRVELEYRFPEKTSKVRFIFFRGRLPFPHECQ